MDATLDTAPASIDALQMGGAAKSSSEKSSGRTAAIVLVVLLVVLVVSVVGAFAAMKFSQAVGGSKYPNAAHSLEGELIQAARSFAGDVGGPEGRRIVSMADGALPGGAYAVSATQQHEDAIRRRHPASAGGSPFADGAAGADRISGGLGFASTPGGRKAMDLTSVGGGVINGLMGGAASAIGMAGAGVLEDIGKSAVDALQDQGKDVVVMFYAPWCGHCKHAKPEFQKAAEAAAGGKVAFVMIDGDKDPSFCADAKVQGFPTILKYRKGAAGPIPFNGAQRTKEEFLKFASSQ